MLRRATTISKKVLHRSTCGASRWRVERLRLFAVENDKLTETLPFRLSANLRGRLEEQARRQERKINWLVRRYVEQGLARDERLTERKDKT